jgi:hypothetical protein
MLNDFLTLAAGVGAIMLVSWLWEYFGWFATVTPEKKKLILFGMSAGVAVLAFVVKTYVPANILEQIAPYFVLIASIFTNLFSGEVFHKSTK